MDTSKDSKRMQRLTRSIYSALLECTWKYSNTSNKKTNR